jgi:hypothetical protein
MAIKVRAAYQQHAKDQQLAITFSSSQWCLLEAVAAAAKATKKGLFLPSLFLLENQY